MSTGLRPWDIVRVRIQPDDRDEHPAVILTCDEFCADERRRALNGLYGTTRRPSTTSELYEVSLNGADGLERPTLLNAALSPALLPRASLPAFGGARGDQGPGDDRMSLPLGTTRGLHSPAGAGLAGRRPNLTWETPQQAAGNVSVFNCGHLYTIDRRKVTAVIGRVGPERRRQIGRKVVATYRLPL